MSDYDYKDGTVYAFQEGVLTVYSYRWTVEMVAWPEPRISVLRDERPMDDIHDPADDVLSIADHVLSQGEDTSFWSRGKEEPKYCEGGSSQRHLQLFWQTIPTEVRKALHLQTMYGWLLLSVFRHCPHALDLSFSNPMLFHLLISRYAGSYSDDNMPFGEIDTWALRKQVDIMAHLDLPATESNRRILLKVIPEARNSFTFDILTNLEQDARVHRIVEHLPRINTGIAHILSYHPPYGNLTGPLLTEIAQLVEHNSMRVYFEVYNDTVDLLQRAGMADKQIYSVRSLERLHDDILRRLGPEALMSQDERKYVFPPPPYPGTDHIEPITTSEELFKEGMEMRHCVAIYAERVANSECYCYRVIAPVRATLEIERDGHGLWRLVQMRGKCNRHVSDRIVDQAWSILRQSNSDAGRARAAELYEEYDPQLPLLTGEELAAFKKVVSAFAG